MGAETHVKRTWLVHIRHYTTDRGLIEKSISLEDRSSVRIRATDSRRDRWSVRLKVIQQAPQLLFPDVAERDKGPFGKVSIHLFHIGPYL
jgi:DNA-binding MarR family transcriptional regulator